MSKEGYGADSVVEAFVAAAGQPLDPSLITEQARIVGRCSVVSSHDNKKMAVQQWMQPSLTSPDWQRNIMTPYCRGACLIASPFFTEQPAISQVIPTAK